MAGLLRQLASSKAYRISTEQFRSIIAVVISAVLKYILPLVRKYFVRVLSISEYNEYCCIKVILNSTIEAYSNSVEDKSQSDKLKELYRYYKENFNALSGYYERGVKIPETRDPGVIHHAGLGSMESNVFTLIGNRMKGRRACWSVSGGNNLAALLCKRYSDGDNVSDFSEVRDVNSGSKELSAAKIKQTSGKGYEYPFNFNTPSNMSFLRNIAKIKPI